MDDFVAQMVKNLKKGNRIRIAGLGSLQVRKHAARKGHNPATGETIKIPAKKKVATCGALADAKDLCRRGENRHGPAGAGSRCLPRRARAAKRPPYPGTVDSFATPLVCSRELIPISLSESGHFQPV
jgi:hypothetical protein